MLCELKCDKAAGFDGIEPEQLLYAHLISKSLLTLLFNIKLHYGYVVVYQVSCWMQITLELDYSIMLMMLSFSLLCHQGISPAKQCSLQCMHGSASTVWT